MAGATSQSCTEPGDALDLTAKTSQEMMPENNRDSGAASNGVSLTLKDLIEIDISTTSHKEIELKLAMSKNSIDEVSEDELRAIAHEKTLNEPENYEEIFMPPAIRKSINENAVLPQLPLQPATSDHGLARGRRVAELTEKLEAVLDNEDWFERFESAKKMRTMGICERQVRLNKAERTVLENELNSRKLKASRCVPSPLRHSWTYESW